MKDILDFVKTEHKRLEQYYGFGSKEAMTYPMFLKIVEELGELSEALLHTKDLQRKAKMKTSLPDELADVLITTLLLAENLDIDVCQALDNKITKIKAREY